MTDPVTIAAAYVLLFGQPTPPPVPMPIADPVMCQLPSPPAPTNDRMSPHRLAIVRSMDPRDRHHHRHHHRGRHRR